MKAPKPILILRSIQPLDPDVVIDMRERMDDYHLIFVHNEDYEDFDIEAIWPPYGYEGDTISMVNETIRDLNQFGFHADGYPLTRQEEDNSETR